MKRASRKGLALLCAAAALSGAMLSSCSPEKVETGAGREIYTASCSSCHKESGKGFRQLYPALGGSPYLDSELETLPCLVRDGIMGSIVTTDGTHNRKMPAFPRLSAQQTAELINYLQLQWAQDLKVVTAAMIEHWWESCP